MTKRDMEGRTGVADCDHSWNSDGEVRYCTDCGQVRTFPVAGPAHIIWDGRLSKTNPLELAAEDKREIAKLFSSFGGMKTAATLGIPWTTLRAWVGTYCRRKTTRVAKVKALVFPNFCSEWAPEVQVVWLEAYVELMNMVRETE